MPTPEADRSFEYRAGERAMGWWRAKYHQAVGFAWYKKPLPEEPYYGFWRPLALRLKIVLQMLIGLTIVVLLAIKFASHFPGVHAWLEHELTVPMQFAWEHRTLEIVANGLAYSAGVDLAYMLFTPGPDEAFEPVILALASGVILLASDEKLQWEQYVGALALSLAIGVVLTVKRQFFDTPQRYRRR
jgi:hypothetical protein